MINTMIFSKKVEEKEIAKNRIYLPIEIQNYILDFIFQRYKEEYILILVSKDWRAKIKEDNEKTWNLSKINV